jgi:hypothetical protein
MSAESKTPLLDALRRSCKAQGLELPRFEAAPETVERHLDELTGTGYSLDTIAHAWTAMDGICAPVSKSA